MKTGDFICARTHADFLNQAFGTNYKAWMSCVWHYTDETIVWMVRFNQVRNGWRNRFITSERIMEENLNKVTVWNGIPVKEGIHRRRIVIEVDDSRDIRKYIFRGIYVYDEKNSDPYSIRYHDKVSDVI